MDYVFSILSTNWFLVNYCFIKTIFHRSMLHCVLNSNWTPLFIGLCSISFHWFRAIDLKFTVNFGFKLIVAFSWPIVQRSMFYYILNSHWTKQLLSVCMSSHYSHLFLSRIVYCALWAQINLPWHRFLFGKLSGLIKHPTQTHGKDQMILKLYDTRISHWNLWYITNEHYKILQNLCKN